MARPSRTTLPRVGFFARGYDVTQVDAVLEAARRATADASDVRRRAGGRGIREARDVRGAAFRMRRRGYEPAAADRMLDKLEDTLAARADSSSARSAEELAATLRPRLARPAGTRFARAKRLHRGYRATEVDQLLARLARTLDDDGAPRPASGLERSTVRGAVFSSARGGKAYDARVVDAYLDRVLDYLQARRRERVAR